ncbi:hypothetical protein Tco_1134602 [Tanacetum coccineum]
MHTMGIEPGLLHTKKITQPLNQLAAVDSDWSFQSNSQAKFENMALPSHQDYALASDMDAQCCRGFPAELAAKLKKSYFELAGVSLMDIAVVNQFRFMDTRSSEDAGLMAYRGNNHADVFFNQDGWTDGGKIEAKYTSRPAELYK